jgi:drug/metabolite transporter (DMT)-like permease
MSRFFLPTFILLAAIWGASFMFIKVADRELQPTTMMASRILLAALILFSVLASRMGVGAAVGELRGLGIRPFLLGIVNAALPFTLIAWGEKHIDSGVAAIGNASMPIFVVLIAIRFLHSERATGARLVGILVGLVGVAVLVGVHPTGGWWAVAGTLAVILATVCYASGSLWAQYLVKGRSPLVLSTATFIGGAIVLMPFGIAERPDSFPSWKVIGCVVALAVLGTAIGQLMYYRLLMTDGSSRASLVTYLMPVAALFYGSLLLGESVTVEELVGLVLILGGVALGSGLVRLARREAAPAS